MQKITLYLISFSIYASASGQADFFNKLATESFQLTKQKVNYDPSYFKLAYPNGDVPASKGVCTDVVIRAYRKLGIDLQALVHEDMKKNFVKYPRLWGLSETDPNIDHRRVPNLMAFFKSYGTVLPNSDKSSDYSPGDIVCWVLSGGLTHIGIVSNVKTADNKRYKIVHNIGNGQVLEDCLFHFKIIGHYRYKN